MFRMQISKSNERCEYSYIGLGDFFSGNSSRSVLIFCGLTICFFFKLSSFSLLKERQIPLSDSKSVKVVKIVIEFYFRKWNLSITCPSGIKILPINPVFSYCVNFIKNRTNHKLFLNLKEL